MMRSPESDVASTMPPRSSTKPLPWPAMFKAAQRLGKRGQVDRHHHDALVFAVEFDPLRHDDRRLEAGRQDIGDAPHRFAAVLGLAVPGRAERHIGGLAENALVEHHVAGDGVIEVAAQRPRRSGRSGADLDHLDPVGRCGMRAEEAAVGEAEADPAEGRLRPQQRQEEIFALDLVVGADGALENDRADGLGGRLGG